MSAVTRLPNWPERLAALLTTRHAAPFRWGSNDCALFAGDAVVAITGRDALGGLRGAWDSQASAARVLRGLRGLVGAVDAHLGPRLPSPAWAQRGDVLLVRAATGRRFLAVCDAARWVAPTRDGLGFGPLTQALYAWPVGRRHG